MSAAALLAEARRFGACLAANDGRLVVKARAPLPDALVADLRAHKGELLALLTTANEVDRNRVLAQLRSNPNVQRAFVNRFEQGAMIVTLAVRGVGTCELAIPAERFNAANLDDYAALLACLTSAKRHCAS